ncbi:TrbC/VirB2 family protein [Enterococcus faecium]
MFESITMNFLTQPKVVAAVDIFRALQGAATSLKNNLMIFAAVAAVASIVIGGIFFFFGRRGAENGKMHVGYVLMGVGVILAAASIVVSLFGMFGQTPQGL